MQVIDCHIFNVALFAFTLGEHNLFYIKNPLPLPEGEGMQNRDKGVFK